MDNFSVYKWRHKIFENQSDFVEKNIQDVTWEDVAGLSVPTLMFGQKRNMDDRSMFDDQWRQETLNSWKNHISSKYPNAVIVINRIKDDVRIKDDNYEKDIKSQGEDIQSDYNKHRKKYQGD